MHGNLHEMTSDSDRGKKLQQKKKKTVGFLFKFLRLPFCLYRTIYGFPIELLRDCTHLAAA